MKETLANNFRLLFFPLSLQAIKRFSHISSLQSALCSASTWSSSSRQHVNWHVDCGRKMTSNRHPKGEETLFSFFSLTEHMRSSSLITFISSRTWSGNSISSREINIQFSLFFSEMHIYACAGWQSGASASSWRCWWASRGFWTCWAGRSTIKVQTLYGERIWKSFSSLFDRCRVTHFRPSSDCYWCCAIFWTFPLHAGSWVTSSTHGKRNSHKNSNRLVKFLSSAYYSLYISLSLLHLFNFQRARRAQPRSFHFHCCRMSTSSECEIVVNLFFLDGIFA